MIIRHGPFTSESVSEGHPDKLADQISDAILDRFLSLDPYARVACETLIADDFVVIAGEFKTREPSSFAQAKLEADMIARGVLCRAGYTDRETGIDPDRCQVMVRFNYQSADISRGVDRSDGSIGAGDQGMVFGYATDETTQRLPLTLALAHQLARRQSDLRKAGTLPWLKPDAKFQVTVRYADGKPVEITAIVLSTQHDASIGLDQVREAVKLHIVDPVLQDRPLAKNLTIHINPAGEFITGGPKGDTGLTGRKIIIDTYGGAAPHSGGAFSGKDPSKVDRSAAYAARHLANQVVARRWAARCLVQIAYAIGVAEPVSFVIETFGTGRIDDAEISRLLRCEFDLTPAGIIGRLGLLRPIYGPTAAYGHFGRDDVAFPWEAA